jgi:UDP-N-acetyl-D-glucosamine dehydrogenase
VTSDVIVVGLGYVGLPLAILAAEAGHTVTGYDLDAGRVKRLLSGESYVEDVADGRIAETLLAERFRPTATEADLSAFDVAVIAVQTPLREGAPDLSYVESAIRTLAPHLRPNATVILESTVYPGTTEEFAGPLLAELSGLRPGPDFRLGFSPERIDPGNRSWSLASTPKLVSGVDEKSLTAVRAFYDSFVDHTVPVAAPKVAELAKLIENTFRHVNIALTNEIGMFAAELGIDVWAAIDAAATKPFGFMPFVPGPGVGGHCLPVDPVYLSWRVQRTLGKRFRFVELANDINDQMPQYVLQRLSAGLNTRRKAVNGSRVLALGMAYKRGTGDTRQSPALSVIDGLLRMGAEVRVADPHVIEETAVDHRVVRVDVTATELAAADAVLILTDHDEFDYQVVAEKSGYVLDCRGRLTAGSMIELL